MNPVDPVAHASLVALTSAVVARLIPAAFAESLVGASSRRVSVERSASGAVVAGEESELTDLIRRGVAGDAAARESAFHRVLPVLRKLADIAFRRQRAHHTLQPTALIHEAYLKLFASSEATIENRRHFNQLFASAMRSVLVDHARARAREKRTPGGARIDLDVVVEGFGARAHNLVDLDDCLKRLGEVDARYVRLVELRFFCGESMPDIAVILDVPLRTLERDWQAAKSWLAKELGP